MKEVKDEMIDPEQFWPEAEKLLEKHYAAKRRRRGLVMFGLVLVGLLSVFMLSQHNSFQTQVGPRVPKEIQPESSVQNKSILQKESRAPIPVAEKKETPLPNTLQKENKLSSGLNENVAEQPHSSTKEYHTSTSSINPPLQKKAKKATEKSSTISLAGAFSTPDALHKSTPKNETPAATEEQKVIDDVTWNHPESTPLDDTKFLTKLPMLTWAQEAKQLFSLQEDNRPEMQNKKKTKWDVLAYAGVNAVQKKLTGNSGATYIQRREQEELPAVLPFGGLQLSKSIRNWDFRGGIEFSVIGEQVKYSPYANGNYLSSTDSWQPNNYTVTDTDSAYIWGILFLNTTSHIILDSVLVTTVDTLNGPHYNAQIRNANGTNRWYLLEMPLEIVHRRNFNRWGLGISAGISPGIVVQSSGYYLKEDESGFTSIKKYNKQQITLSARAGLEVSYLLNAHCRILLRPSTHYFLTRMTAGEREKQRYQRNGVSVGLLYMFP